MVWDSTTFNIHDLQLTTSVLSVHVSLGNKTNRTWKARVLRLLVFQSSPRAGFVKIPTIGK